MAAADLLLQADVQAEVARCLLDATETPAKRHRALFSMRNMPGEVSRAPMLACLSAEPASQLLRHELAYALGQMGDRGAAGKLREVALDRGEHPMVRHEAAEALGAIADASDETAGALARLVGGADGAPRELRETAALALRRIRKRADGDAPPPEASPYLSVDPADPLDPATPLDRLEETLLAPDRDGRDDDDDVAAAVADDLERRYGAIFALRDRGTDASAEVLCRSLVGAQKNPSALLRHEVAYVLGQMERPEATDTLIACLSDEGEHVMVRHEAAEALGAVAASASTGASRDAARAALRSFGEARSAGGGGEDDDALIVRESCAVALDLLAREEAGEFEYVYIPDTKRSVDGKRGAAEPSHGAIAVGV